MGPSPTPQGEVSSPLSSGPGGTPEPAETPKPGEEPTPPIFGAALPPATEVAAMEEGERPVALRCSSGVAVLVSNQGNLYLWGSNVLGGMGLGEDEQDRRAHIPLSSHRFPSSAVFADAQSNACALLNDNSLYVWGLNRQNEFAPDQEPVYTPSQRLLELDGEIRQVSITAKNLLLLTKEGSVYRTGARQEIYSSYNDWSHGSTQPELLEGIEKMELGFRCQKVDSTPMSYLYLSEEGEVYLQGVLMCRTYNGHDKGYAEPTRLPFPERVVDIALLATQALAIGESGNLYAYLPCEEEIGPQDVACGGNVYRKALPSKVVKVDGTTFTAMALTEDGRLYGCGENRYHMLGAQRGATAGWGMEGGDPCPGMEEIPFDGLLEEGDEIEFIHVGEDTASVLTRNGQAYMWGGNIGGQILGSANEMEPRPFCITPYLRGEA